MELFQLRYFMLVSKYENFTKAAEELFITQPSVSKAINMLEKELGVSLFERNGKKIKLSRAGKALQERLAGILSAIDNLPNELHIASGASQSTITLNILSASSLIPEMLSKFKNEHPLVNFHLIQKDNTEKYDLCLCSTLPDVILNNGALVLNEELMLAVPITSRFAVADSIDLHDLKDEGFIMPNKKYILNDITSHYFELCGYKPDIAFESENPYTIRELVEAGLGISIWPEVSWGKLHSDRARLIGIRNPVCRRNIFITWPGSRIENKAARFFLDFAKSYFKQLAQRVSE